MRYNNDMKYSGFKSFIFIFLFFPLFSTLTLRAEGFMPPHKPYPKRDFFPPEEDNSIFLLRGIRTSPNCKNIVIVDFLFNKIVDPASISELKILINNEALEEQKILFSKDGRKVRIFITDSADSFAIDISGLKAWTGEIMQPVYIENITEASDYYLNKEYVWKKRKPKCRL